MKNLNETFTDEEYAKLKAVKEVFGYNWHDFIMRAADDLEKHGGEEE